MQLVSPLLLLWPFKSIIRLKYVFFHYIVHSTSVFHVWSRTAVDVGDVICVCVRPHPCYQCVADIPRPSGLDIRLRQRKHSVIEAEGVGGVL